MHSVLCGEYRAIMPATGCEDVKPHFASSFTEPSTYILFADVWQSHVSMQVAHNVNHIQGTALYCALDSALCHQSGSWYNWMLEERTQ